MIPADIDPERSEEDNMRFEALVTAVLVLSQISAAAAEPRDKPQFTFAESQTVERNELLRALIHSDPWLVREILDAVAEHTARNGDGYVGHALDGISRAKNPDLVSTTHTAAGSVEWLDLLRRARDEKKANANKLASEPRSANVSVETLQMFKGVKDEKQRTKEKENAK
jgi:hypothetical protein